ncbi:hypothetical protein [Embleya sp. NPDC001921]
MTHEPTIPWPEVMETRVAEIRSATVRLSLLVSMVAALWAVASEGVLDPGKATFLLALAGIAGRSTVGYVRVRRH